MGPPIWGDSSPATLPDSSPKIFLLSISSCVQAVAPTTWTHLQLLAGCGSIACSSGKNGRRKTPRYCSPRAAYGESTRESDGQEKLRGECRQLVDSGAVRAGSSTRIGCRDPTTGRCQVSARCGLSKSRTEREVRKWGRKRIRRKGASTCFFRGLLRVLLERKQCHSALFLHLRDGI
jgi:hypothetical protein